MLLPHFLTEKLTHNLVLKLPVLPLLALVEARNEIQRDLNVSAKFTTGSIGSRTMQDSAIMNR